MEGRQEARHIAGRLARKALIEIPEIVEVIDVLGPDGSQDAAFTAVVGRQYRGPVAKDIVQFLEVGDGRRRGFVGIHAFIDELIAFEAKLITGRRDELPQPQRPGAGERFDVKAALDQWQPGKFLRESRRLECFQDLGPVAAGAFEGLEEKSFFGAHRETSDLGFDMAIGIQGNRVVIAVDDDIA